jgi:DNA-binding NtrC family response regulator
MAHTTKERFDGVVDHLLDGNIFLGQAIEVLERSMIQRAMERSGGVQSTAAKQLGIHRNTLQAKMAQFGFTGTRTRVKKKLVARQTVTKSRRDRVA